jgi:hypothetical protein
MSSTTPTPKWKLALIPILLLVLVGTLWNNFSKSTDEDMPELLTPANHKKPLVETNWKLGRKDAAIAFNPFKEISSASKALTNTPTPTLLPSPIDAIQSDNIDPVAAQQNSLESLTSQPVTLLIRKGKKDIAVIGDQVIHSGQRLDSGYQVEAIDLKRILLSNQDGQITLPMGETPPQN